MNLHRRMFRLIVPLTLVCVVRSGYGEAQGKPDDGGRAQLGEKMLNRQVGWDDALPGEKNPAGLRMEFVPLESDPFLQASGIGHYVRYRVLVPGARGDQTYVLAIWKIGSQVQVIYNQVYVNAKGLLMVHAPRPDEENKEAVEAEDELDLAMQAAAGEPVRYALIASDGKLLVPGTIVPYPVANKAGNCRVELRLATPDGEAVLIYADGLEPGSEVPFQSWSGGEAITGSIHTNAKGHGATVDLPYAGGKNAGVLRVSIAAKGCAVSAEIPWGKGSYKPL